MWSQNELVKLLIEHQNKLIRLLGADGRKVSAPAPEPPEPAPRRLRQSERPGIDMAALGRAAREERLRQRLPRNPEEARKRRCF